MKINMDAVYYPHEVQVKPDRIRVESRTEGSLYHHKQATKYCINLNVIYQI